MPTSGVGIRPRAAALAGAGRCSRSGRPIAALGSPAPAASTAAAACGGPGSQVPSCKASMLGASATHSPSRDSPPHLLQAGRGGPRWGNRLCVLSAAGQASGRLEVPNTGVSRQGRGSLLLGLWRVQASLGSHQRCAGGAGPAGPGVPVSPAGLSLGMRPRWHGRLALRSPHSQVAGHTGIQLPLMVSPCGCYRLPSLQSPDWVLTQS